MEDNAVIELYFRRSERAITATKEKYGRLLLSIAYGLLRSRPDAEECENDTYFRTWNVIPPQVPQSLSAFLSRIVRNLSLDRLDQMNAEKRGGGEVPILLEELAECLPDAGDPAAVCAEEDLGNVINRVLSELTPEARSIFLRRYFFGDSVKELASCVGCKESRIKMSLLRSRERLKRELTREGYVL